jgi:putative phage-type endonuclease
MSEFFPEFFVEQSESVTEDEATWLANRAKRIGASDAPIICGVSRFESPYTLYHKKVGTLEEDREAVERLNEALYWGKSLEPAIVERFGKVTGMPVSREKPITVHLWRNDLRLAASLDAIAVDGGVPVPLEVKNVSAYFADEWEDEPPIYYVVQCQHQMMVSGAPHAYLAALVGGNTFRWAKIMRDDAFIGLMRESELEFLYRLAKRIPPNIDGSDETKAFLKKLYPKDTGAVVKLPPESLDWDAERLRGKALIDEGQAVVDLMDNQFRAAIGEASVGALPNGVQYSNKWQHRNEYVVKENEFRVLRRSGGKKK